MNRNVPTSSAKYLRASSCPSSDCDRGRPGRSHHTHCGPRRANQERVAPRPAEDLDELEPVDRLVGVGADRDRAMALEQHGPGQRLRRLGERRRDRARRVPRCPAHRARGRGRRGRNKAVSGRAAGSGASPASGQRHRRRAGGRGRPRRRRAEPRGSARWIARSDVGREAGRLTRLALRVTEPDDDEVVGSRARPCAGPSGVTSSRSASRRTDRLPSPAEIRPRAPSRRPARTMRVGGRDRAPSVASYGAARPVAPSVAIAARDHLFMLDAPIARRTRPPPSDVPAHREPRLQGPARRARASRRSATRSASRRCRCSSSP